MWRAASNSLNVYSFCNREWRKFFLDIWRRSNMVYLAVSTIGQKDDISTNFLSFLGSPYVLRICAYLSLNFLFSYFVTLPLISSVFNYFWNVERLRNVGSSLMTKLYPMILNLTKNKELLLLTKEFLSQLFSDPQNLKILMKIQHYVTFQHFKNSWIH